MRHNLEVSYVYELPLREWVSKAFYDKGDGPKNKFVDGWELSGITLFQSGTPFSVINGGSTSISSLDNAGVANGAGAGSYADVVGNPSAHISNGNYVPGSVGPLLYNPAAFVAPQALTFGTSGRNYLTNPSRLNFDMALLKHVKLQETRELELRAEAFNVFNHTQFRIYDPAVGNTASNTITCYGPGPYSVYANGQPLITSGPNLSGAPNFSAAGGQSIVTTYVDGVPEPSVQSVNCLNGSQFLHPVDAHRPRTIELGIKFSF